MRSQANLQTSTPTCRPLSSELDSAQGALLLLVSLSNCCSLFQDACSSSESLTLINPMDPNSYSPQDSFSSSSSSCYDSPTRMETNFQSFASESYHYQHCGSHQNYVPGYWPGQLEGPSGPEYTPYYHPMDYPYACTVEENYFRKEFPLSSEMCYNVL